MQNPGMTVKPKTTASPAATVNLAATASPEITDSRLPTKNARITNGVTSSKTTRLIFHRSCGSEAEGGKPTNKKAKSFAIWPFKTLIPPF
jgi:hypothetical protein